MNNYINHLVTTKPYHLINVGKANMLNNIQRSYNSSSFEANQEQNKAIARILFDLDAKLPSHGLSLVPMETNTTMYNPSHDPMATIWSR